MSKLLLATENKGKLVEIQAILADTPVIFVLPSQIGLRLDVAEDGETYAENAARKALAYMRASGMVALADDSGLEVDALGGQPGVHSHRFVQQPGATDADRRAYLLRLLAGLPRPWQARFRCVAVIATPAGQLFYSEGECAGEIIPEERGSDGFGYDPIFFLPEYGLTMAEIGRPIKNTISHRARAVGAARPLLRLIFTPAGSEV
jgi:XTP/dITP diphosphohydrolase